MSLTPLTAFSTPNPARFQYRRYRSVALSHARQLRAMIREGRQTISAKACLRRARLDMAEARRLWLPVLLLALALPFALHAAEKAPRHVTRPISSITVKVVSQADFTRGKLTKDAKPYRITAADADSCTAWVRADAKDVIGAELAAFKACRVRLAVQAQRGGAR